MVRGIVFVFFALLIVPATAQAQQVNCQALLNEIMSMGPGAGNVARAMQIQQIYNANCLGQRPQQQQQRPPQPYQGPPQMPKLQIKMQDCGGYKCREDQDCAKKSGICMTKGAQDCGQGHTCPAGSRCITAGKQCALITRRDNGFTAWRTGQVLPKTRLPEVTQATRRVNFEIADRSFYEVAGELQRNFIFKEGVFGLLRILISSISETSKAETHIVYYTISCAAGRVEYFMDENGRRPFNHASDIPLPRESELVAAVCENLQQ